MLLTDVLTKFALRILGLTMIEDEGCDLYVKAVCSAIEFALFVVGEIFDSGVIS
jgi:hypothetical protein